MTLLGNLIWLIFGGLITGVGWMLGGLLLCLTVIGIPFGLQAIKIGMASFAPFGKDIVETRSPGGTAQIVFNLLWLVFVGWELAVAHLVSALVLAITIIGLPFAKQHIKLIPLTLMPFGRDLA